MKLDVVVLAACLAVSLPVRALEQDETVTEVTPGADALDPAALSQLLRRGDPRAMNNIGLLWAKGYQGKQSWQEALRWWKEAAQRGYTVAMNNIGLAYANGNGVEKDMQRALDWWLQSAFFGNAWAMNAVGDCYERGDGVEQDYMMAMTWYQSAAQQGDRMGMFNVGALFEDGKGVEQDYVEALSWYRRSAEKGDASAMHAIGRFYREGLGVSTDIVEAWAWQSTAQARFTPEDAEEAKHNERELVALGARLTLDQLTQARARAAQIDGSVRPPKIEPEKRLASGQSRT
ncbi:MAG TPA: tetratricopeptide repeat protein [Burkholderiales bacterium]|nr:tetratricopeptide repeat protein [Burkholderiales bacterium]